MLRFSIKLQQLLLEVLSKRSGAKIPKKKIPHHVTLLQEYLSVHFREDIFLDEMAITSQTSKYYLLREFKKYLGCTPKQYILSMRIQQARELLEVTTIPSYKIGAMVGFPSEANFIAQFKKAVGITPGAYRNK